MFAKNADSISRRRDLFLKLVGLVVAVDLGLMVLSVNLAGSAEVPRAPTVSRESQRRALSTVQHPSASMMASCSAGRTSRMLSFARVGWTRFVSKTTQRSSSGSSQIDVPV